MLDGGHSYPAPKGGTVPTLIHVLWPNGLLDQDETWHRGRSRPKPHKAHIVLDGDPAPPQQKGGTTAPTFSAHVYCGQTAGWIKMPLGTEVGLGAGHIVLDGDPAPPKWAQPPIFGLCLLWPNGWMDRDAT